jgi:hypothetical protein
MLQHQLIWEVQGTALEFYHLQLLRLPKALQLLYLRIVQGCMSTAKAQDTACSKVGTATHRCCPVKSHNSSSNGSQKGRSFTNGGTLQRLRCSRYLLLAQQM